ncbi:MAG: hypothetical protein JSU65_06830 [Candidatus Zixiibacteriota bacterium]|nr:MAG: hypothetical protein JSU65_06830 [candidate division Zixibacteria bacterium]
MKRLSLILLVLPVVFLFGCDRDPVTPTTQTNDEIVPTEFPLDSMPNPPLDPELLDGLEYGLLPDSLFDVYRMRIVWGNLANVPTTSVAITDWTGKLGMNALGAILVRSVIAFEPGQDSLLPRDSRVTVAWVSKTTVSYDGLELLIITRNDAVYITPPVLSFVTDPLSIRFNFRQLVDLDTVVHVDNQNAVAFRAKKLEIPPCPYGYLAGKWSFKAHSEGIFEGRFLDLHGLTVGFMRGKFWTTDDGMRRFEGGWVDLDGNRRGPVWGEWFMRPYITDQLSNLWPVGGFTGYFGDYLEVRRGHIAAEFFPCTTDAVNLTLAFRGKWGLVCRDLGPDN